MKLKFALGTATALALTMGSAWAGDTNETYVNQRGKYNQASINQAQGEGNKAGSSGQAIRQVRDGANPSVGLYNTLTIEQSGDDNTVGLGTNANGFGQSGVYQEIGYAFNPDSSGYVGQNVMGITQTSDGNTVGSASQVSRTHAGGNTLSILQRGDGGNTVGSVSQFRDHTTLNVIDVDQAGRDNTIARVQQAANSAANSPLDANRIDVEVTGIGNGNWPWTGGGAAAATGAISSALIQGSQVGHRYNRRSTINLAISGNYNEFGVSQYGEGNSVGLLTISGSNNELGITQEGTNNTLALAEISGSGNQLGVDQDGTSNWANLVISGNDNGGGTLAGAAGLLADTKGLVSGLLRQNGLDNSTSLTVAGGSNQVAVLQQGNNNLVNGSIAGSGSNSATVAQVGNGNKSSFSQNGGGNVVAVSQ